MWDGTALPLHCVCAPAGGIDCTIRSSKWFNRTLVVRLVGLCDEQQWILLILIGCCCCLLRLRTKIWWFCLIFSSVRPHLKNRLVNMTKRGKWSSPPSELTRKSVKKEHSLPPWCYWCTHINDSNLKQWYFIAGLLLPASAVYLRSTKEYHSGMGWLPANIFVSHALSPIFYPLGLCFTGIVSWLSGLYLLLDATMLLWKSFLVIWMIFSTRCNYAILEEFLII